MNWSKLVHSNFNNGLQNRAILPAFMISREIAMPSRNNLPPYRPEVPTTTNLRHFRADQILSCLLDCYCYKNLNGFFRTFSALMFLLLHLLSSSKFIQIELQRKLLWSHFEAVRFFVSYILYFDDLNMKCRY